MASGASTAARARALSARPSAVPLPLRAAGAPGRGAYISAAFCRRGGKLIIAAALVGLRDSSGPASGAYAVPRPLQPMPRQQPASQRLSRACGPPGSSQQCGANTHTAASPAPGAPPPARRPPPHEPLRPAGRRRRRAGREAAAVPGDHAARRSGARAAAQRAAVRAAAQQDAARAVRGAPGDARGQRRRARGRAGAGWSGAGRSASPWCSGIALAGSLAARQCLEGGFCALCGRPAAAIDMPVDA